MTTAAPGEAPPARAMGVYVTVLAWLFGAFNTIRVLTYVPTIAAIFASGDSDQHSLWTWGLWFASNLTMALWLLEQNGRRPNGAVVVTAANAAMCALTAATVALHRS